jgi:hypothetical protein
MDLRAFAQSKSAKNTAKVPIRNQMVPSTVNIF